MARWAGACFKNISRTPSSGIFLARSCTYPESAWNPRYLLVWSSAGSIFDEQNISFCDTI